MSNDLQWCAETRHEFIEKTFQHFPFIWAPHFRNLIKATLFNSASRQLRTARSSAARRENPHDLLKSNTPYSASHDLNGRRPYHRSWKRDVRFARDSNLRIGPTHAAFLTAM
jgi:hypothetical protein